MNNSFVNHIRQIILDNIEDENFGVGELSKAIRISRFQLYRKIKETNNKSVSKFILEVRLEKAYGLLVNEELSVSEIAYKVGFSSPSYFNKSFKSLYGCAPGELKKKSNFPSFTNEDLHHSVDSAMISKKFSSEINLNQKPAHSNETTSMKSALKNPFVRFAILIILVLFIVILVKIGNLNSNSTSNDSSGVKYFNIVLPEKFPVSFQNTAQEIAGQTALAISDDGKKIVYITENEGKVQLALRFLNQDDVKILEGTDGAYSPFFSPDGKWIAYFKTGYNFRGTLNKVSIETGISIEICPVSHPFGGDWGKNGDIIFADNQGSKIRIINENGGKIKDLALYKGEKEYTEWLTFPKFLPGENMIVTSGNPIAIVNLKDGNVTLLNESGYNVHYVSTGHLVFTNESKLIACRFDIGKVKITGSQIPFFSGIRTEPVKNPGQFSIAQNGILVYAKGAQSNYSKFVWVSREGEIIDSLTLPAANYGSFSISPSGDMLSYSLDNDVWVFNMKTENKLKVPATSDIWHPFLNSDGTSVAFNSKENDSYIISYFSLNSTQQIKTILKFDNAATLDDWSTDNKYLGFHSKQDIYAYSILEDTIFKVLYSEFFETQIDFSPDSKYFVYLSDENGYLETFAQPFPVTGEKWNISNGFGIDPIWSFDGEEIFFRSNNQFFSVKVNRDSAISFEKAQLLFTNDRFLDVPMKSFAVSNDRKKILVLQMESTVNQSHEFTILENWFDELNDTASQ